MRSLHREDGEVGMAVDDLDAVGGYRLQPADDPRGGGGGGGEGAVDDLDAVGCYRLQPAYDLGGVGGVGHEVQVVVRAEVDDQVVDDAATGVVTAQRVLRLAGSDAIKIIGQALVDESLRSRPPHI